MLDKLLDNRFWYVGFTAAEFGGDDFNKCPCLIIRNPFSGQESLHERSHKSWMKDQEYSAVYEQQLDELGGKD